MLRLCRFRPARPPRPTLFPYTTLFRSGSNCHVILAHEPMRAAAAATVVLGSIAFGAAALAQHITKAPAPADWAAMRSEEHTSELQSHHDLVCRLLLEKKNSII